MWGGRGNRRKERGKKFTLRNILKYDEWKYKFIDIFNMVDKKAAPAFSLGSNTKSSIKDNGVPGPGSYNNPSSLKFSHS